MLPLAGSTSCTCRHSLHISVHCYQYYIFGFYFRSSWIFFGFFLDSFRIFQMCLGFFELFWISLGFFSTKFAGSTKVLTGGDPT